MEKLRRWGRAAIIRWTGLTSHIVSLFVFLVLLNILDYQTTDILVGLTDYSVEANPIYRSMMELFDSSIVIVWIKGGVLVLAAFAFSWCLSRAERERRSIEVKRMLNTVLMGLCFAYTLLVIYNTHGIYLLTSMLP